MALPAHRSEFKRHTPRQLAWRPHPERLNSYIQLRSCPCLFVCPCQRGSHSEAGGSEATSERLSFTSSKCSATRVICLPVPACSHSARLGVRCWSGLRYTA
jgi:hypothetical protein